MGVISTFDPKFKRNLLAQCIEKYGEDNVVLIKKSKLFLWVKILFPFIGLLALFVGVICLCVLLPLDRIIYSDRTIVYIRVFLCVVASLAFLPFGWKILKYFLDYCMDFAIVTPESFLRYDQTGFFKRTSKAVDLNHIRSVSVKKSGLIGGIFNNGYIIILSDGSGGGDRDAIKNNPGEIIFRYVYNPDYYSDKIQKLMNYGN